MKRLLPLFLLASCSHAPVHDRSPDPGLFFSEARERHWSLDGGAGNGIWKSSEGHLLRIQAEELLSPEEASSRIKAKQRALLHFVEAQVDPYYGSLEPNGACDLSTLNAKADSNLRFQVRLGADRDLQFVCYGPEIPEYSAQVILLYCRGNRTLYELKAFSRVHARPPLPVPFPVSCRN